ncbi:dynactin subunit P25 [Suhomyces tanzawaensis NRRL Y-17324]|uniref:Dynactin subunit 5 n=1 Tax=Suhomyces tanzawaensis NRRL Y-17324 TaxID=984487 RepID=A0A1E4SS63_9ASCO|nr:dynactin subunit P25 [Suhomyces tanzawaensis NRRL Y-17324]ODV82359.1 dynactin subunit P25 [Suhomyces tanzawaensis NRRL Y-17324]
MWIETSTGNRIAKDAAISGPDNIVISGNCTIHPGASLHGDVTLLTPSTGPTILIGKYSHLNSNCQIIPPVLQDDKHGPVAIGAYCIVGHDTVVRLATIGNRVIIEDGCDLQNLSIIYDCCVIRKGTVVPPKMVIPPFSEVLGVPGTDFKVGELSNAYKKLIETEAKELQLQT